MAGQDCFCVSFHEVEIMTMMIGRDTSLLFTLSHPWLTDCPLRLSCDFITTNNSHLPPTAYHYYIEYVRISSWQTGRKVLQPHYYALPLTSTPVIILNILKRSDFLHSAGQGSDTADNVLHS